jgi:propanol-preferring alcohol dehydrogenase
MLAMAMTRASQRGVEAIEMDAPEPAPGQVLIAVSACGVCRTDLHVVDGDLAPVKLPIVPGHEIVGRVVRTGGGVEGFAAGDRVGVPWLGGACGACAYCTSGRENLCRQARYTGYQIDGGYAELTVADARFCFPMPDAYDDVHAAPLLCAGLIGYRAYRMAGPAARLGLYGFGAAAHILAQVARHHGREVYAFVSPGDRDAEAFARRVGATWAGPSTAAPPATLDAAIIFAPVGRLVPEALAHVAPGGTVVCAGIHMSDIPAFPYRVLWEERVVRSVANLTRADAREFLDIAARMPIETHVHPYALRDASVALDDLRGGRVSGAAVLVTAPSGASRPRTSREPRLP